jgi:hypothetical protein
MVAGDKKFGVLLHVIVGVWRPFPQNMWYLNSAFPETDFWIYSVTLYRR